MQRARATVQRIVIATGDPLVALGTLEVRQHILPAPAFSAHAFPVVIVRGTATDVHHAVDRGTAAQTPSPRLVTCAASHGRLRQAVIGVIEFTGPRDHQRDADRRRHQWTMIVAARFQQGHLTTLGISQPPGYCATRRPSPDHDEIVSLFHTVTLVIVRKSHCRERQAIGTYSAQPKPATNEHNRSNR
ncbi:hypothetical protein D3C77_434890 [compost metagenome]